MQNCTSERQTITLLTILKTIVIHVQTGPGVRTACYSMRTGREYVNSPPCSAEVKNAHFPNVFMACYLVKHMDNSTFKFLHLLMSLILCLNFSEMSFRICFIGLLTHE